MSVTYSKEFWDRALKLASIGSKQCEKCKGFTICKGEGRKTVRVVMVEGGTPLPYKLRLLCTTCCPGAREFKLPRKQILAKVADLFEHAPDKARTVNGR